MIEGLDIVGQIEFSLMGIADERLACDVSLLQAGAAPVNPGTVYVTFSPGATGVQAAIPRLERAADCAAKSGNGWYFDSPATPTKIELCSEACRQLPTGRLDVLTGCLATSLTK